MKQLSRSVFIMFIFDLLVYSLTTTYWYNYFELPITVSYLFIALITICGLTTTFLKGNYKIREFNITKKNIYLLFEGIMFAHIPALTLLFLSLNKPSSYKFLLCNIITVFVLLIIYRILFHLYLFNVKSTKNILILGTDERARIIADEIQAKKALKMNVAAFVQLNPDEDEIVADKNTPIYVMPNSLKDAIKINNIDVVVIAQPTELIIDIPRKVKIYKMPDFYEMTTGKYYVDEKTITELYYQFAKKRSYLYDFCKRVYDIIAASIILLVTLPITVYIAIRVKFTDGGSPMFTQTRMGKGGKPFECYKLRTMYLNDFVPKNGEQLTDNSDRVMPFCKFVRKAKLDEIPQMINILKGEMSIVGPRAEWEQFARVFKEDVSYYSCRMWVKTGWTGWAHVSMPAAYSVDEEKERLAYDLYYIKHRNVLWEIGILVKAVFMAISGRHL